MNKLQQGVNDLATVRPDLAAEWHPMKNGELKPSDVLSKSNKKVWWKCKRGHSFEATMCNRVSLGRGCPYCSGRYVISGVNDLETCNPVLASEWHPIKNGDLKPFQVLPSINKKVWWLCKNGHEWEATLNSRSRGVGCPVCANKQVLQGYNDLATINPALASEWHPTKNGIVTPQMVSCGSTKKYWWLCKNGHEWFVDINNRYGGNNCPYCSNQKVLEGYNDLATTNPEIANEWHPTKNGLLTPSDVIIGSSKKVWWMCSKEHEWYASLSGRKDGCGCPICANKQILVGYNDLSTTNPELANEWHPTKNGKLKPTDVMSGGGKKVWWLCKNGHEWQSTIASRNSGTGCPICKESHLEKITRRILNQYDCDFTEQVKFDDLVGVGNGLLSYDFAIYSSSNLYVLVECQGVQHYEPAQFFGGEEQFKIQQEHDRLKREYARDTLKVRLIEIPYTATEREIEEMLKPDKLFVNISANSN